MRKTLMRKFNIIIKENSKDENVGNLAHQSHPLM